MVDLELFRERFKYGEIVDTQSIMEELRVSRPTAIAILHKAFVEDEIISCSTPKNATKYYMVI